MKFIKLLILSCLPFLVNAQTYEKFAAYGTTSSLTLSSGNVWNFTITGFTGNARPYGVSAYAKGDVQVGDKIFISCNQWTITSITSTAPNLVGTMTKIDGITPNPTNGQVVAILREFTAPNGLISYTLPPNGDGNGGAGAGISISLAACIKSHYSVKDSIALNQALNSSSIVTGDSTNISLQKTGAIIYKATLIDNSIDSTKLKFQTVSASNISQHAIDSLKEVILSSLQAINGLTKSNNTVELGGTLSKPTLLITDNTNTLSIQGLPSAVSTDNIVTIDNTGKLSYRSLNQTTTSQYINHQDAGNNGVTIGQQFETSQDNTMGLPIGTVIVRRY